jgi:hypothetical protein
VPGYSSEAGNIANPYTIPSDEDATGVLRSLATKCRFCCVLETVLADLQGLNLWRLLHENKRNVASHRASLILGHLGQPFTLTAFVRGLLA